MTIYGSTDCCAEASIYNNDIHCSDHCSIKGKKDVADLTTLYRHFACYSKTIMRLRYLIHPIWDTISAVNIPVTAVY